MNLQHRQDRRESMYDHLTALGFIDVTFPATTSAKNLDLHARLEWLSSGLLHPTGSLSALKEKHANYIANALDQLGTIHSALNAGHEMFAIFEDDLVPAASYAEANRRIKAALDTLPDTADMLYLEYCNEDCSKVAYSYCHTHVVRAHAPCGTAAIVFTQKGARKIVERCLPVWGFIDGMYRSLIHQGTLEAYLAHPVAFFQDRKWGSDVSRERNTIITGYLSESCVPKEGMSFQRSLPSNVAPAFLSLERRVRSVVGGHSYDGYVHSFRPLDGKFLIVYDDGYQELRLPDALHQVLPEENIYILPE